MKYKTEYAASGVDSSFNSSLTFEADSDAEAEQKAKALIAEAQASCNKQIRNPFWHWGFKMTTLSRLVQEEISETVPT